MELSAGFRRSAPPPDPAELGEDEALAGRIRAEIATAGPMTFARFMELALYDPDGGYYRAPDARPGRAGDFMTAPELHPIFGRCVARQLTEAWDRLGRPDPFVVEEHGAGSGALAEAILRGLAADGSGLLAAIRYVAVEVEPRRTDALRARLEAAGFGGALAERSNEAFTGAILANEVLDALPVHRVGVRDGRLRERFVTVEGDRLVDAWADPSTPALAARLTSEGIELAEGQSAEICLAIDRWLAGAAQALDRGLVLLVDYGAPANELYDPNRRPDGTLRAFARHRLAGEVYAHIGRQDLTAHVDLTAVEAAARTCGLASTGHTTLARFLLGAGAEDILRAVQEDPATTLSDYVELRSALMRLLDPAGLGGFHVLAFGRRWGDGPPLRGFSFRLAGR